MEENKKVDLRMVLSVSGYSSLFKFIAKAKNGVLVEALKDRQRTIFGESAKVSSLGDIAIYTDKEEMSLLEVFKKMKTKENGGKIAIDIKTAKPDDFKKYFESIIPDYDKDRLYVSHMKKIIDWYNQLQADNMLDFAEPEAEKEAENDTNNK